MFVLPEEEVMTARNVCGADAKWMARMGFGPLVEALTDTHTVSFSLRTMSTGTIAILLAISITYHST